MKSWGLIDGEEGYEDFGARRRGFAARSLSFGIAPLDDIAVGLLPTDLIVLSGSTGSGKTDAALTVASSAAKSGARVKFLSLESYHGEMHERMFYRKMSELYWDDEPRNRPAGAPLSSINWRHGRCSGVEERYGAEARRRASLELKGIGFLYGRSDFDHESLVRFMSTVQKGTDLVVLDHLHFLDIKDDNENRGMKATVKALNAAVLDTEVPVLALAHLRKPDARSPKLVPNKFDLHGSSDISKIATKVICLAPAWQDEHRSKFGYMRNTFFRVDKDRDRGATNYAAICGFDLRSNEYEPNYHIGRLKKHDTHWEELKKQPSWALHATRKL